MAGAHEWRDWKMAECCLDQVTGRLIFPLLSRPGFRLRPLCLRYFDYVMPLAQIVEVALPNNSTQTDSSPAGNHV